jgi:predicted kinase
MSQFLLQMAGDAGSGKSTLARAIGRETGAIVLDKDVVMSALMNAGIPAGPDSTSAGMLSYEVIFDLASSFLEQRFSVVIDSPAYFIRIRDNGLRIAERTGARYCIIECALPEITSLQERLATRSALVSQPRFIQADRYDRPGTALLREPHLTIDTSQPVHRCLAEAMAYLRLHHVE